MRATCPLMLLTLLLPLLLGSCSSPPAPPTVDEASKRPVNSAMAVNLQVCESALHNTRLVAAESSRLVQSTSASLARLSAQQQAVAATQNAVSAPAQGNSIYTIRFDFGSTRVSVPPALASSLIESARAAPLVLLRGRTDGVTESTAESRIARERAAAVRDYLVAAGVDLAHIRSTYQPVGDRATDDASQAGQALSRRVEIEVYRALPVATEPATTSSR